MSNTKKTEEVVELAHNSISIAEDVFTSIVSHYVLLIPEVVQFASASLVSGLANMIGKKTSDRPIRIDIDAETSDVTVSINLVIKFGVFLPDVAAKVQKTVSKHIKDLTGNDVASVNVFICNLTDEETFEEES
jgi:uncharacterized alkaline shock family protein YloU